QTSYNGHPVHNRRLPSTAYPLLLPDVFQYLDIGHPSFIIHSPTPDICPPPSDNHSSDSNYTSQSLIFPLPTSHFLLLTSHFPLRSFVLLFPLHAPRRMVLHQTFHRVLDDVADLNMQFGCNNLHILPKMISYGSYKADFYPLMVLFVPQHIIVEELPEIVQDDCPAGRVFCML